MEAVGYVWGDFAHNKDRAAANRSPDDAALGSIARAASGFAGRSRDTSQYYPTGPMNSIVYPVAGGMEDWGYAASWEPHHVGGCRPSTHGGYAPERTRGYANATARAAVFLVEATNSKAPREATLGKAAWLAKASSAPSTWPSASFATLDGAAEDAADGAADHATANTPEVSPPWPVVDLSVGSPSDGHVPRNVRFALAAIDMVRPYVQLDVSATIGQSGGGGDSHCLSVRWRVWGALRVDATQVVWTELSEAHEAASSSNAVTAASPDSGASVRWRAASPVQSGTAIWGGSRSGLGPYGSGERGFFSACVQLPVEADGASGAAGGRRRTLLLAASAAVDQAWGQQPERATSPVLKPQTHLVRARTDPAWALRANGREVHGQTSYLSDMALEIECEAGGQLVAGSTPKARLLAADGGLLRRRPRGRRAAATDRGSFGRGGRG